MRKTIFLTIAMLLSASAFAHANVSEQTNAECKAVAKKELTFNEKTNPRNMAMLYENCVDTKADVALVTEAEGKQTRKEQLAAYAAASQNMKSHVGIHALVSNLQKLAVSPDSTLDQADLNALHEAVKNSRKHLDDINATYDGNIPESLAAEGEAETISSHRHILDLESYLKRKI